MRDMSRRLVWWTTLACVLFTAGSLEAETGAAAWLRYERINEPAIRLRYDAVAGPIVALDDSSVVATARDELIRGLSSMLDRPFSPATRVADARLILGTAEAVRRVIPKVLIPELRNPGAFWIGRSATTIVVAG